MKAQNNEKLPNPKEIEKEIGEFLNKKFGGNIKIITPALDADESTITQKKSKKKKINFGLKPDELISYLDQYVIKQDIAKQVLATKICTHFSKIKHLEKAGNDKPDIVGNIKSNIIMIGPTGVGKTYLVKLIAKKLGIPFAKGDATKFSETGYVGGDVEDLIRDLVREADDDIELAQYGIVYIDEIDKIASSQNIIGHDISRTGVQRALLKPMEETEIELKVPHDPISIMQEIERFQKTGKRDKRTVNTANILFIVSGAFGDLPDIIRKRVNKHPIGFGAEVFNPKDEFDFLQKMKTEDLVQFGFETEFIGRLPVRAVFEKLTDDDLYAILKTPNNPVILGKKLDFASYGIDIKFDDTALMLIAQKAFDENTGARGLVSSVEEALLMFENKLPSSNVKKFPVTKEVIENPKQTLKDMLANPNSEKWNKVYESIALREKEYIKKHIELNWKHLSIKHNLTLSSSRNKLVAEYFGKNITNLESAIKKIKYYYEEVKKLELSFFNTHGINIILEENAIDFIIEQFINSSVNINDIFVKLTTDFEYGLKLVQEKTGKTRFFINHEALMEPEEFIAGLIKDSMGNEFK